MGRPPRHPGDRGRALPDPARSGPDLTRSLPGSVPSPNIWDHPGVYELENRAFDRDELVEAAMLRLAGVTDWSGRDLLDIGCGSGFHLPRFARSARSVTGVEPHAGLRALAERRTRREGAVRVLPGTAQSLPLPPASVDVVHARWAYFFGPGCEPGLAEVHRVLRRGGVALVIDNDPTRSLFGHWFRRGFPHLPRPEEVERFWSRHGWTREPVLTSWRFECRADLERVVRIELPAGAAAEALAGHEGTEVEYAVNLWWRRA